MIADKFGQKDYMLFQLGPRQVFRSTDKKFQTTISVLGGYNNLLNNKRPAFEGDESDFSFPINLDAAIDDFTIGLCLESNGENSNSIFLRVGYGLNK